MIRNYFLLFSFLALTALPSFAQISAGGTPPSFSIQGLRQQLPIVTMPGLDMPTLQAEDEQDAQMGMPPRFGYPLDADLNLNNSGMWEELSNGDRIWRLSIECRDARSINLLYDDFRMPPGGQLFIYNADKSHIIGAFTEVNNKSYDGFATGLVYGDKITLEYYEPKAVRGKGMISVAKVVHGYRLIREIDEVSRAFGGSGACQVDVNCPEGANWQSHKSSVAMILVNGSRICTGSLVNNVRQDCTPLFLTADHCIGSLDAISNPNASTWTLYWNYESPACNPTTDGPINSTSGATLLANDSPSDFAVFLLSESPLDAGYNTYFAGWDATNSPGSGGVGIHHPSGDVKKIATHSMTPLNNDWFGSSPAGSHWEVAWDATANGHSVTEGGSSGSPLFNAVGRVIGQLHGGSSINCSDPANDPGIYGQLAYSWLNNGATDNRRRLRDWLDPDLTGLLILDGTFQPCSTSTFCAPPSGLAASSITETTASVSWSSDSSALSYTFEYRPLGSSTWTTINNATSPVSLTGLDTCTTYNIQLTANCDSSNSSPSTYSFQTGGCSNCIGLPYCAAQGGTSDEWIGSVVIGSINNASGNDGGYGDYTGLGTFSFTSGNTYNTTLTPAFSGTAFNEWWHIYLDINQDGDFTDAGELIYDSGSATNAAVSGSFTIPPTALTGSSRLRVVMEYNTAPASCGTFTYGEVEDYCVDIIQGSGNPNDTCTNVISAPYTQDFENAGNIPTGWVNDVFDDGQDWEFVTGATPSVNVGPDGDHTTGTGYYAYVEDSSPYDNDNVSLLMPCVDISNLSQATLSFWYNSYERDGNAANANELHIDILENGSWNLDVIPLISDVDTNWNQAIVDLTPFTGPIKVRFRVNNNNGTFTHDIAIDDVNIYDNVAPPAVDSCQATVSFPYSEDFDNAGTIPANWNNSQLDDGQDWEFITGPTGSVNTGPDFDHTSGSGYFAYVEDSSPNNNDNVSLVSPCIDLSGATAPFVSFWYHSREANNAATASNENELHIDLNVNGVWYDDFIPVIGHVNAVWNEQLIDLTSYVDSTIAIRFRVNNNNATFSHDIAIDDVNIFDRPQIDIEISAILSPSSNCGLGTETITVEVSNNGLQAVSNIPVGFQVNTATPVLETITGSLASGQTTTYTFLASGDFSSIGNNTLTVFSNAIGDGNTANDILSENVIHLPIISVFPYNESFEAGNGYWMSGGDNNTWAMGTPAKTVISGASDGVTAWTTGGLTSLYNNNEDSYVQSPCFDFTNLTNAYISMDIWWQSEYSWDGANLQASIDGGQTWMLIGAVGDSLNWYNDTTITGLTSGIGWTGRDSTNGSMMWTPAYHSLSMLDGEPEVRFRVVFGSDGSVTDEGFAFDNVTIAGDGEITCSKDNFEPNENPLSSAILPRVGINRNAQLCDDKDRDFFNFELSGSDNNIRIVLSGLAANLGLRLYDASLAVVDSSLRAGTDAEGIVVNNASLGLYYIEVFTQDGSYSNEGYKLFLQRNDVPFGIPARDQSASRDEETLEASFDNRFAAFPNPFDGSTTLAYTLATDSRVSLEITNLMGQIVAVPVRQGEQQAGSYDIQFDGSELPSGIYYAVLRTEQGKQAIKLVLTK